MSFKLNDYNSFLSSLYERDKADREGKFPIDFDFGLNTGKEENPSGGGGAINNSGLSPNPESVSSPDLFSTPRDTNSEFPFQSIGRKVTNDEVQVSPSNDNLPPWAVRRSNGTIEQFNNIDEFNDMNELDEFSHNNDGEGIQSIQTNTIINPHGMEANKPKISESTIKIEPTNLFSPEEILRGSPDEGNASGSTLNKAAIKSAEGYPFNNEARDSLVEVADLKEDNNRSYRPRMRSSHNVIEQRYRNKINDKFAALQESVPTLRTISKRKSLKSDSVEEEPVVDLDEEFNKLSSTTSDDLEGLEPARKLNKGTILTKSVEYIKFLELKNSRMRAQQEELIEKAKLLGIPLEDIGIEHMSQDWDK